MSEGVPAGVGFKGTSRFQLVRQLGQGGMGVVYEAFDRVKNVKVALKTIHALTAESLLRFKNEFRALQDLRHPNLISLGELQESGGTWFFTMELIDGVDFYRHVCGQEPRLAQGSALPDLDMDTSDIVPAAHANLDTPTMATREVAGAHDPSPSQVSAIRNLIRASFDAARLRDSLRQLTVGLSALHAARMVHRDIKPGNILVTPEQRVVILDFGLVADATGRARDQRAIGTPAFMAPEQAAAASVGPAADWFSVGVTLYLVLTGRHPFLGFRGQSAPGTWQEPTPPAELVAEIPAELSALCLGLLRRDPERRLDGRAILTYLDGGDGSALALAPVATPPALFVGRAHELELLREAFTSACAGQAVALLMTGESGVGKSALAKHFVDELASRPDTVVLAGRCYERESVPYKAVDQIIDALGGYLRSLPEPEAQALLPARIVELAGVFPALREVEPIAQAVERAGGDVRTSDLVVHRLHVFTALRELLGKLAQRRAVVLSIDDLQWADADSLALLADLLHPPEAPPLLLCATVRSIAGKEAATLARLRAHLGADVREVRVERLPPEAARELVSRLVSEVGAGQALYADSLAAEAAGHPLFIDALVRHRLLHPHDAGPVRLDDALVARSDSMGPAAARLLELVCIAGGPLAQEACANAAGIPFGELTELVGVLRAANLVKTNGVRRSDVVEPYHDRVREAIAGRASPDERKHAHARLARALEARQHHDAEMLAVQFRGAGDLRKAARYAARAADRAADALAFDRAARLYHEALELDPATPAVAQSLRLRFARALALSGRSGEAGDAFLEAAQHAAAEERLELHRLAAEQFFRAGRIDDGARSLQGVLATVGMQLPRSRGAAIGAFLYQRVRLKLRGLAFTRRDDAQVDPEVIKRIQVCHGMLALGMTNPLRGHTFQMWNLRLSLDAGVPARICRPLASEIAFSATAGLSAKAKTEQLITIAEGLASEVGDPYLLGFVSGSSGIAAYLMGEWRRCQELCDRANQILSDGCTGADWELDSSLLYCMRSLFFLGELGELRRRMPLALKAARERGDLFLSANLDLGMSATHVGLADGEPAAVRARLAEAIRQRDYPGFHVHHLQELWSLISVDLFEGDVASAERRLAECWPRLSSSPYMRMQMPRIIMLSFRGRVALAGAVRAQGSERAGHIKRARQDARAIRKDRAPWGDPLAALLEAGIAACESGNGAAALAALEQAAQGFDAVGMALHAAVARWQRGKRMGGDEGAGLAGAAEAWMRGQSIASPERFAALLAPGLAPAT